MFNKIEALYDINNEKVKNKTISADKQSYAPNLPLTCWIYFQKDTLSFTNHVNYSKQSKWHATSA